jgi:hypothetical protein
VPLSLSDRTLAVLLVMATLPGCYRTTLRSSDLQSADRHRTTGHLYLLGSVGELEVDVRDYCGDRGAAEIRSSGDVLTVAVTVATLGIYSPRRVHITCGREPQ